MKDTNNSEAIAGLNFIDETERTLFAEAQLGQQAIQFLRSPLGRYMHGRVKELLDESKEKALACNPDSLFGRRKLRKIRAEAVPARLFMQWCTEVISEGDMAAHELDTYRTGE